MRGIHKIIKVSIEVIDDCLKHQEERRQMVIDNIKRCEAGVKAFQEELDSLQDIETGERIQLEHSLPDLERVLAEYSNIVKIPERSVRYRHLIIAMQNGDMTQMDAWLEFMEYVKQDEKYLVTVSSYKK